MILNSRSGYFLTIQTLIVIRTNNTLIIHQNMTQHYLIHNFIELLCTRGSSYKVTLTPLEDGIVHVTVNSLVSICIYSQTLKIMYGCCWVTT